MNNSFKTYLDEFAFNNHYDCKNFYISSTISIKTGDFNKFIHPYLVDDSHFEIPILCRNFISGISTNNIKNFYCSIFDNSPSFVRDIKSPVTAIKFFSKTLTDRRVGKVRMPGNLLYYGGQGLILDRNKRPLFLLVVESEVGNNCLVDTNLKIYIDPEVTFSSNMLEKSIMRYIIPYYLENGIRLEDLYPTSIRLKNKKVGYKWIPEVVICPFEDKFFTTPSKPNIEMLNDSSINSFLLDNVNMLTSIIEKRCQ